MLKQYEFRQSLSIDIFEENNWLDCCFMKNGRNMYGHIYSCCFLCSFSFSEIFRINSHIRLAHSQFDFYLLMKLKVIRMSYGGWEDLQLRFSFWQANMSSLVFKSHKNSTLITKHCFYHLFKNTYNRDVVTLPFNFITLINRVR